MAGAICTNHPEVGAIGKCSRCEKPYCLECLDIETGRPLCQNCLTGSAVAPIVEEPPIFVPPPPAPVAPPIPPRPPVSSRIEKDTFIAVDDLNMDVKDLENKVVEKSEPVVETTSTDLPDFKLTHNDPLGLFKEGTPPPPVSPLSEVPQIVDSDSLGGLKDSSANSVSLPETPQSVDLLKNEVSPVPPVPQTPSSSVSNALDRSVDKPSFKFKPLESFNIKSSMDPVAPILDTSTGTSSSHLNPLKTPSNKAEREESMVLGATPIVADLGRRKVSMRDLHAPQRGWFYPIRSLVSSLWLRINLISSHLKIPGYLLLAIILVIVAGGITLVSQLSNAPAVMIVDSIPAIDIIPMDASEVSNLDITAFSELQNQLGALGFVQILQMMIPQLPAPNFFDIGLKPNEETYSEILQMPSQIEPRVSFVTVFTNGVWYSTNGWEGTNQQLDYLVSEFYPNETPEQLYNQHQQGIQKLQTANDWQIQKASLNRYMSDLSDHLRWFVTLKNILPYQANFTSWH